MTDWFWQWSQQQKDYSLNELDIAQLLAANTFGASFNTTVVLVQCLCELATRPKYASIIREEVVKAVQGNNGIWTKEGIDSMKILDSFIKESHRYNCFDHAGTPRVVKQNFRFKNGLHIPKGTVLMTPNAPMLFDERYVKDPFEFDSLRFYDLANSSKAPEMFRYTSTNSHYLQFGDGKHVWLVSSAFPFLTPLRTKSRRADFSFSKLFSPGRFFAADELRLILSYLVFHFEIKLQEPLPENVKIKRHNVPYLGIKVLLKKMER